MTPNKKLLLISNFIHKFAEDELAGELPGEVAETPKLPGEVSEGIPELPGEVAKPLEGKEPITLGWTGYNPKTKQFVLKNKFFLDNWNTLIPKDLRDPRKLQERVLRGIGEIKLKNKTPKGSQNWLNKQFDNILGGARSGEAEIQGAPRLQQEVARKAKDAFGLKKFKDWVSKYGTTFKGVTILREEDGIVIDLPELTEDYIKDGNPKQDHLKYYADRRIAKIFNYIWRRYLYDALVDAFNAAFRALLSAEKEKQFAQFFKTSAPVQTAPSPKGLPSREKEWTGWRKKKKKDEPKLTEGELSSFERFLKILKKLVGVNLKSIIRDSFEEDFGEKVSKGVGKVNILTEQAKKKVERIKEDRSEKKQELLGEDLPAIFIANEDQLAEFENSSLDTIKDKSLKKKLLDLYAPAEKRSDYEIYILNSPERGRRLTFVKKGLIPKVKEVVKEKRTPGLQLLYFRLNKEGKVVPVFRAGVEDHPEYQKLHAAANKILERELNPTLLSEVTPKELSRVKPYVRDLIPGGERRAIYLRKLNDADIYFAFYKPAYQKLTTVPGEKANSYEDLARIFTEYKTSMGNFKPSRKEDGAVILTSETGPQIEIALDLEKIKKETPEVEKALDATAEGQIQVGKQELKRKDFYFFTKAFGLKKEKKIEPIIENCLGYYVSALKTINSLASAKDPALVTFISALTQAAQTPLMKARLKNDIQQELKQIRSAGGIYPFFYAAAKQVIKIAGSNLFRHKREEIKELSPDLVPFISKLKSTKIENPHEEALKDAFVEALEDHILRLDKLKLSAILLKISAGLRL